MSRLTYRAQPTTAETQQPHRLTPRPLCKACGFNRVTQGRSLCNDCIAVELGGTRPSVPPTGWLAWFRWLFAALLLLLCPVPARALTIQQWTWTGQCETGCQGTASFAAIIEAAGAPVRGDYRAPLVSSRYTDSVVTYDFGQAFHNGNGIELLFPVTGDPVGKITVEGARLREVLDGTWQFQTEVGPTVPGCFQLFGSCTYEAMGIHGVWVDGPVVISWPATVLGFALGWVGMEWWRRRKRQP